MYCREINEIIYDNDLLDDELFIHLKTKEFKTEKLNEFKTKFNEHLAHKCDSNNVYVFNTIPGNYTYQIIVNTSCNETWSCSHYVSCDHLNISNELMFGDKINSLLISN
jgi:hypothetical protein